MSNRNFDSRYVIQRLMDRVNAQNLYGFQKNGVAIINNPQNSDPSSYRIASYNAGAETTVDRGLIGGGYSVSFGGIANLIDTVTARVTVTVPSSPTDLVVQEGDSTVTISFTPGDDGGSPIINYEYSLDNGITFVAFLPAQTFSPVIISGLTNGTTYTIKIRAVNSVGSGQESTAVIATPTSFTPPTISLAWPGDTEAYIYFIAGNTGGGSSIDDYEYSLNNGAFTSFGSTASPLGITGLTINTPYSVKIRAKNDLGDYSSASNSTTVTPVAYVAPATATLIYDPTTYSGTGQVLNTGSGGTVSGTNTDVFWVNGAAGASSRKVFDFSSGANLGFGNFDFGTSITIMAWVYPRAGGDYPDSINCLIGNTVSNAFPSGFKFGWNYWDPIPSRSIFMEAGNDIDGGSTNSVNNIIQYNQWQHIAYIFDRNNSKAIFFWNGQPVDMPSITTVDNIGMNNESFAIGTFTDGSYWVNAQLGILSVYKNTLLNAEQILQDYESTKANYGL